MQINKQDEAAIRKRIKDADTTIRAVAAVAGTTERTALHLMNGDNVTQKTYDAFMSGLEQMEALKEKQRSANSQRAQGHTPILALA